MGTRDCLQVLSMVAGLGIFVGACSSSNGSHGGTGGTAGSGGAKVDGSGGVASGSGGASTTSVGSGGALGGTKGTGGLVGTGGLASGSGGTARATGGATSSGGERGDASVGTGGRGRGDASVGSGGGVGTGGTTVDSGGPAPGGDCVIGTWPTADPSMAGPFAIVTENPVGPQAGVAPDGGTTPQFTMFRPKDMAQGGLCHPVITWGNGTNVTPAIYKVLLNNLASHGFVVIGSNSTNVAQGNPAPMLVGVTWVLQQNEDPSSALYHRIDATHIGATGHSQGAMATTQVSGDSHITTSAPIEGASAQRNLHGPAMFFCGGQDTLVGCSGAQSALAAVTTLPAMYAEFLAADHGSWMTFSGSKPSPVETAITAWMRVHLMGDAELRSWFYGPSCKLCTDSAWKIDRKNMDQ
jgi:hypothetical protein